MRINCTTLYERLYQYSPCQTWLWPVSLEDLKEPILQPPVYTSDSWVPPRLAPFESSNKSQEWPPRHLRTTGSSTGSWEIDAAHPDISSSPTSQMAATHVSSRQQSVTSTGGHDVQDASEGIELRPAKANVLLGQYHMERSGQFVSAKPGRNMGPGTQHNSKRDEWHFEDRGPSSRLRV
ncbi:hypothetical protein WJX77_004734 [Trebouxia sp. C0004]